MTSWLRCRQLDGAGRDRGRPAADGVAPPVPAASAPIPACTVAALLGRAARRLRRRRRERARPRSRCSAATRPRIAAAPDWWGRYPFEPDDVALKIATPIADLYAALYALRDAAGAPVSVRGSAGVGVFYAALPAEPAHRSRRDRRIVRHDADRPRRLLRRARRAGRRPRRPRHVGSGPRARSHALGQAAVRSRRRLLAPGRFVGGI